MQNMNGGAEHDADDPLSSLPAEELAAMLREADPDRAAEVHPRDARKMARSLQVLRRTGVRHSELLRRQRRQEGGSDRGGPLRFENCLVLWVKCQQVRFLKLDAAFFFTQICSCCCCNRTYLTAVATRGLTR